MQMLQQLAESPSVVYIYVTITQTGQGLLLDVFKLFKVFLA